MANQRMDVDVPWCRSWERRTRLGLMIAVSLAAVAVLCFSPRVPLGPGYHHFADTRTILEIPHFLDVLSNIPFVVVGVWGVFWLLRKSSHLSFVDPLEKLPYLIFFCGVAFTGVGSFWYHMAPGNSRLLWDLLPMTCSFMSMVTALIVERISVKAGIRMLIPLLVFGLASVAYWYFTETRGRGDYRFYLFVQFFPPLLLAMTIAFFPPRYTGTKYLAAAFIFYVLAKVLELFDKQVYSFTGIVSGHSLKHVTAALSCYCILLLLQRRRAVEGGGEV